MKVTAEQYARSVLALGLSGEQLDAFQGMLVAFSHVLSREPKLRGFLLNPEIRRAEKESWLSAATSDTFARFILTVLENHDTKKLAVITARLEALRDEQEGLVRVTITSASPLAKKQVEEIQEQYEVRLKKKVRMVVKIDHTLLGGITITVGDAITDASIKTRLEVFQKSFTHN